MSHQALRLIQECNENKNLSLDLSYCGLTEIPKEVFELTWLEELQLSNAYWDDEKYTWIQGKNTGDPNKLDHLPAEFSNLINLKHLYAGGDIDNYRWRKWDIKSIENLKTLEQLTILHLSFNKIEHIKPLENLSELRIINLSSNYIQNINMLKNHPKVIILNLGHNQIQDISTISYLKELTFLDISKNKIENLTGIANLIKINSLILTNNKIKNIEPLKKLTQLNSLKLSRTQVQDIKELQNLTRLNSLDLSVTQIKNIETLKYLTQLNSLSLSYNKIHSIEPLQNLTLLNSLDLSSTQIQNIQTLKHLTQLNSLILSHNEIHNIEPLKYLTQLNSLSLPHNKIHNIESLQNLTQLKLLNLAFTQIQSIKALKSLTQLSSLNLSSTKLQDFDILSNLNHLRSLNLCNTSIQNLEPLKKLTQLSFLNLHNVQINDFTGLKNLTHLTKLDLSSTNIQNLEPLKKLKKLNSLDISNTQIHDLRPLKNILEKGIKAINIDLLFPNLIGIGYMGCPLTIPPMATADKGNEAILNYFEQIEKQGGTAPLYEAKLLIVGEPGAGKTTLLKKLKNPAYIVPKEGDKHVKSTLGIHIEEGLAFPYSKDLNETIKVNVWDFGGQEIQYMTHQFFITPGALYVLVVDDRKQQTEFDYWFRIINLLGRENESEKVKTLVVLNEIKHTSVTNFDLETYQENYPNLSIEKRDIDFSVKDGRGTALISKIQQMLSELPEVTTELPLLWKPIRADLMKLRNQNYINFEAFANECRKEHYGLSLTETEDQEVFSAYMHRLGLIQHYQESDSLYNFVILNPNWAVEAVYTVLKDTQVYENKGRFTNDDLKRYWSEYTHHERSKLLDLMLKDKFEICYRSLQNSELYISPQLLPTTRPHYPWNNGNSLKFRYRYPFMPKGLISRLIVRLNENIAGDANDWVWKNGVVIDQNGCKGQIIQEKTVEEGLKVLDIEVIGDKKEQKFLLKLIRTEIENIHRRSFPHIKYEQMIPCDCEPCIHNNTPHFYEYSVLKKYLDQDIPEIRCDESLKNIPVIKLLEGVFEETTLQKMIHPEQKAAHHYHGPTQIFNDTVTESVTQINTKRPKQNNTPITESSEIPKKWFEQWWIIALMAGIATFGITWWISTSAKFGAVAGSVIFLWFLIKNPEFWLRRLASISLAAAISSLLFQFNLAYEHKGDKDSIDFSISETPVILSIVLIVFAIVCVIADVYQNKRR